MKNFFLILCLMLFINFSFSQNKDLKEQLKSIENQWHIDDLERIVYKKTINVINTEKSILFKRVQKFLAFSFIPEYDAPDITTFDESYIISAKGNVSFLQDFYISHPRKNEYISVVFVIECFDNSVNLSIFYKDFITDYQLDDENIKIYTLNSLYPFNERASGKNITGKAFYESFIFNKEKITELKEYLEGNKR